MIAINLPKALDIESNILGALLLDKRTIPLVIGHLKTDIFYDLKHQKIFNAIKEMYDANVSIDLSTVAQKLSQDKDIQDVGGAYYLSKLTDNVVSSHHINSHIEIVIEMYKKREAYKVLKIAENQCLNNDSESIALLSDLNSQLIALQEYGNIYEKSIEDIVLAINYARDKASNGELLGFNTGFEELNHTIAGWCKPDLCIIAARPGAGKCLGYGTKVIMFDGTTKEVQDLQVGEYLMGVDSKPRRIMSLARGMENMYWVRQNNGFDYRVNESHILSLKRSRNGINIFNGDVLNIPVKEYLQKSDKFKTNYKGYKTGFERPDDFSVGRLSPYMLGLWLGDGTSAKPGITAMESEIIDEIYSYGKKFGLGIRIERKHETSVSYYYNKGSNESNVFWDELKRLNLVNNKHIPNEYLLNSRRFRLQLLAGLLDTDGYLTPEGKYYEIVQKNQYLGNQIAYLARTLGFRVNERKKIARSQNGTEVEVLRISISGNINEIPCRVRHKIARVPNPNKNHLCTGIKVEFDKFDNYYGFTLDQDGLFLLEDTTVTHNTAMMLSSVYHLAILNNVPTAIFSLEMSSEQLVERLESITSQVPLKRLRTNNLNDYERKLLLKTDDKIIQAPIYIEDTGGISISQLRAKATILKQKYGIKVIFLDYLQLMSGQGKSNQNREQEVSLISRSLKALAKELEVPIIALSQLSRKVEERADKLPMLSDLRESGSIEQDSDIVIMLMRPSYYEMTEPVEIDGKEYDPSSLVIVKVEKNRHGPTKNLAVRFIGETTTFEDYKY